MTVGILVNQHLDRQYIEVTTKHLFSSHQTQRVYVKIVVCTDKTQSNQTTHMVQVLTLMDFLRCITPHIIKTVTCFLHQDQRSVKLQIVVSIMSMPMALNK
jgi:hypothetical protein